MKIAIKGHKSRGKEVIQILENLGGENRYDQLGSNEKFVYFINNIGFIYSITLQMCSNERRIYTLEEFEKEFPFKIGDKVTIIGLPDFPKVITQMVWDCDEILYSFEGLNNTWFGAKSLKKVKMKEERNITLTLEKAKEWYQKGGELKEIALQAYSEEKLTKIDLPKTWEEFCKNYPVQKGECWLSNGDDIMQYSHSIDRLCKNWIPSKKSAEAHLAMIQLEQLRNCWRQGNIPQGRKYKIRKVDSKYIVTCGPEDSFLSFCDLQTAEEFLKCFRELIEKAGDLI